MCNKYLAPSVKMQLTRGIHIYHVMMKVVSFLLSTEKTGLVLMPADMQPFKHG